MASATITPQQTPATTTVQAPPQSTPQTTPQTQPATDPSQQGGQVDGLRQLRETYENLKKEFEPWQKLGAKPEQVNQWKAGYEEVFNEASELAQNLGYEESDLSEAIQAKGLSAVRDFLRQQAWQRQQAAQGDQGAQSELAMREQMEELVQQHIGPIQERENLRQTEAANQLFERTVHQLAVEHFKAEGLDVAQIPQDEMSLLMSATSEILKYDEKALLALKYEGKTAAVQQAFKEAQTYLDKYYLARAGRDRARLQPARPGQPQQAQPGAKKYTLDELAEDPSRIDEVAGRDPRTGRYRA